MSEALLASFSQAPLLDPYAVYQHLMDYWAQTMQDDAYLIAADGWVAEPWRIREKTKAGKMRDKGWVCELLPKPLIVARYFANEQAELDAAQAELDSLTGQISEMEEEHSVEDAAFAGFERITLAQVRDRIREIESENAQLAPSTDDEGDDDELEVLTQWLALKARETALRKQVRELDAELDHKAFEHYATLDEADVKSLLVDDKWMAHLSDAVQGDIQRVAQTLTGRIRELAERYAQTLPQLTDEVATLAARVEEHLVQMGAEW